MNLITYLSFAVAPVLLLLFILIYRFGFEIKKMSNVLNAIILGMISTVLIVGANYLIDTQWHGNYGSLRRLIFYVVIVIALSAEVGKYIVLRFVFFNKKATFIVYNNFRNCAHCSGNNRFLMGHGFHAA